MSCDNLFNGCAEEVADKCIKYTGASNSVIPICQGDSLFQLEQAIITQLLSLINGTGINANTQMGCTFLKTLLNGAAPTAAKLFDVYQQAICSLKTDVTALQAVVGTSTSFNTSCLTGLPSSPTRDQILQALLTKVCSMDTRLTAVESDYVKATQLNSLIAAYISGASTSIQQNTKMVPYVAYEYYGPLSNFDNSGIGLSATGYSKVYICNGSNGTPDKRGRVAVGAIQGVPGGAMDSAVDPSLAANAGNNYALKQKFGISSVTLDVTQMPAHSHPLTDPGHIHSAKGANANWNSGSPDGKLIDPGGKSGFGYTQSSLTGITIGSAGSSQPHDNRQPSIAAYYIMYLPS